MHKALILSVVLASLAATSCRSTPTTLGWTRPAAGVHYPPTDAKSVEVLERKPDGAELLGQVHGVHRDGSPLEAARIRAAELGADAIVILVIGDEESEWLGDPFPIQFVEANAWRKAR